MKISASLFAIAAAVPAKDPKGGKLVQDPDAPRIECGGQITDEAIITSPGFDDPGHYFNNLDCTWEINIPDVSGFTIYPEVFEVVSHYDCAKDQLNINWVENTYWPPDRFYYKFCARFRPSDWENFWENPYTTAAPTSTFEPTSTFGPTVFYGWTTDAWTTDAWTTRDYYDSSDSSSSSSSGSYSDSDSLGSSSSSSSGRKRRAQVEDTLNNSALTGGDERFFSGIWSTDPTYIGNFTEPLQVKGGRATIRFRTDTSTVFRGFKLRIEKGIEPEDNSCDQVQYGSGSISSPGFPEASGSSARCKYTLNAEEGKMIKITFDKFESGNCFSNSLSILGRKHCHSSQTKSPVEIMSDSTEIVWNTNGHYGKFSFTWESVENPIQTDLPPLESALGFHNHMEIFLSQMIYQMEYTRRYMIAGLNRFWDRVQITEEYFQTSGSCDWSYSTPTYQSFEFKTFNGLASQCENLANFRDNAMQFIESFVCMDEHEVPKRTFVRWMKLEKNINKLIDWKTRLEKIC